MSVKNQIEMFQALYEQHGLIDLNFSILKVLENCKNYDLDFIEFSFEYSSKQMIKKYYSDDYLNILKYERDHIKSVKTLEEAINKNVKYYIKPSLKQFEAVAFIASLLSNYVIYLIEEHELFTQFAADLKRVNNSLDMAISNIHLIAAVLADDFPDACPF